MSTPSEKELDDQPLYSPSQAYRQMLHAARDADRNYMVTGASLTEEDLANVQFESFVDDGTDFQDDDYGDILASAAQTGYEYRFDEEDQLNLDEILEEGEIKWDATLPELESSRLSTISGLMDVTEGELLEDSYFPGYLDDAVNGKVPSPGGMSLLEAFDKRLEHEKERIRERLGYSNVESSPQRLPQVDEEPVTPVRDDDVMAAILGIRIDKKIQNLPETELTKAIDNFMKADMMHDYHVKFEIMQQMSKRVVNQLSLTGEHDSGAGAAPIGKQYPKFDVIDAGDASKPLEIITYIGSTRGEVGK